MFYLKIVLLFILTPLLSQGQTKHLWQGQQGSKRILLELNTAPDGSYQAYISSPEYWINHVQADSLFVDQKRIQGITRHENIKLEGTFSAQRDSIMATITIHNKPMTIQMGKVDSLQPLYFPQNPRPPYPYRIENASYTSCDSIQVAGTVTLPAGKGPFPAVIIVSGTGKQDRDGTFAGHKPFHRIADYLTRQGFIVLRTDDRGTGKTTGQYEEATTRDFARDAQAGIHYLKGLPQTNKNQIGIIGHSEGGQVAFILGAESPDVAFVVSLAGVGVDGLQILKLQNEAILRSTPGMTPERVDHFMSLYNVIFGAVLAVPLDRPLEQPVQAAFDQWIAQQDEATLKNVNLDKGRKDMFISRYLYHARGRWYREMIRYNPELYIPKINKPVLAMNGDKDIMVPCQENLSSIKMLLDKGGNTRYRIAAIPGLNHMFQHCQTCTREEIPDLEEVFAEEALQILGNWLQENVR